MATCRAGMNPAPRVIEAQQTNGPKVSGIRCLREIRLNAGKPGASSGTRARKNRCTSVMTCDGDNPRGVPRQGVEPGNQQERLSTHEAKSWFASDPRWVGPYRPQGIHDECGRQGER